MSERKSVGSTILKIVLGIVITVAVLLIGGYCLLRFAFGVDLIDLYNQIKLLSKPVVETEIVTYPYEKSDSMVDDLNTLINNSFSATNIVSKDENGKIIIDDEQLSNASMTANFQLTDKQLACFVNASFDAYTEDGTVTSELLKGMELLQIKFSDLQKTDVDNFSVKINTVIKVDLAYIKSQLVTFPLSIINGLIPQNMYVDVTITLTKNQTGFHYEKTGGTIKINSLTEEESSKFINTLNDVIGIGTSEEFAKSIGGTIVDMFIGNDEVGGFSNTFNQATNFTFIETSGQISYVLICTIV